jgi:hypothetical protein
MKKIQDNNNNNIVIGFIICYNSNKLDLYLFIKNNTVSLTLFFYLFYFFFNFFFIFTYLF